MVQFNLLPDVKIEFLRARRIKRIVTVISAIVGVASVVVLLLSIILVDVVQKKSLHDLNRDVGIYSAKLKAIPDLGKILTVQNQLNTLTSLHDQKVVASRLFGYLSKVTPAQATISNINIDFTANTMVISGEAPNLDVVNTYTDTLKATTYKTDAANSQSSLAFSNVVLSAFGRDSKAATYTITLSFDPVIFSSTNNVSLSVPSGTQSNTSKLFQQAGN